MGESLIGKRNCTALRRHSDSCLDVTDDASRIPPLHGVEPEDGEEIDDDWFAKLATGNETWVSRGPADSSATNYGLGADFIPLLTGDVPDLKERTLRTLRVGIKKIWKRDSATITETDATYKVAYLGNVLTGWAKGEGSVEKPLNTLWKNYSSSCKPDVQMKLTVTQSGLKAVTKDHGLTEYWSHRITFCSAPTHLPRVFCWVYRHEGRRLKQELRCHAVLCSKESVARRMATTLRLRLAQALIEFKRDKLLRQNARLSLANSVYENPSLPRRKILLSTGSHNYRPPLERSKSAPKLMSIEESLEEEESTPKAKRKLSDPEDKMSAIPEAEEEERDIEKVNGLNFYKKLCSSIENLVETTSTYGRRLRRASKDLVLSKEPLLKKVDGSEKRGNYEVLEKEEEVLREETRGEIRSTEEEIRPTAGEVRSTGEIRPMGREIRPRKSVTFECPPTESTDFAKCVDYKKVDTDESSDEGASSLQSISSCGSDEAGVDYARELSIYKASMDRLHNYLDLFLTEDVGGTVIEETDSLSDEDSPLQEEDVVSDESGYVELAETSVRRLSLDSKEKDVPFHQIVKSCVLRPRPIESSCLQV